MHSGKTNQHQQPKSRGQHGRVCCTTPITKPSNLNHVMPLQLSEEGMKEGEEALKLLVKEVDDQSMIDAAKRMESVKYTASLTPQVGCSTWQTRCTAEHTKSFIYTHCTPACPHVSNCKNQIYAYPACAFCHKHRASHAACRRWPMPESGDGMHGMHSAAPMPTCASTHACMSAHARMCDSSAVGSPV